MASSRPAGTVDPEGPVDADRPVDATSSAEPNRPADTGGVPAGAACEAPDAPQVSPEPPGTELRLEGAARLAHGETRVFELEYAGRQREAFVLAHQGRFFAYLNECPHWSVELDLGDGHFYDEELDRVYCKNHGAIFSPTTGECDSGPCLGRSLVSLRARRDGDDLLVSPTSDDS